MVAAATSYSGQIVLARHMLRNYVEKLRLGLQVVVSGLAKLAACKKQLLPSGAGLSARPRVVEYIVNLGC